MRLFKSLNRKDLLFRATAFVWGFSFFLYFRHLLDVYFPFYRAYVPLTEFALIAMGLAFLAASLFYARSHSSRSTTFARFVVVAAIVGLMVFIPNQFGDRNAFLYFPLPLTFLAFCLWYLLARYALFFQSEKIYLIAGAVASLYLGRFFENARWAPGFALVAIILTQIQKPREWQVSHERLLLLRQLLDFLRYLFLAQAFHSALDLNRENLLAIVLICGIGFTVPQLVRVFKHLRPHIQQGLLSLPVIFFALALAFNTLHYTYWGATAYALLAVWESIYFARAHEMYLKREKVLAGIAFIAAVSGYYIASDWLQILMGVMIAAFLAGTVVYVAKNWRKTITALFAIALLGWIYAIQEKYAYSVTREFIRLPALRLHKPQLPDANVIVTILSLQKKDKAPLYTNLVPRELLGDSAWQNQNIYGFDANAALLTSKIAYACYLNKEHRIYILEEKSLENYSEPSALLALRQMLESFKRCEIYLSAGGVLRNIKHLSQTVSADSKSVNTILSEDAPRLLSLGRAEKRHDQTSEAWSIYEQIQPSFKEDPQFLREFSALAASRGYLDRQIQILNDLIRLKKDNTSYDKKLLMELYALKNERKKSAELAYAILAETNHNESPLAIYAFLQKLFSEPFDRYEMEALYRKISAYQPKTDLEALKHEGLKRSVEVLVKQNKTGDIKFRDENHRQEFITFPE